MRTLVKYASERSYNNKQPFMTELETVEDFVDLIKEVGSDIIITKDSTSELMRITVYEEFIE